MQLHPNNHRLAPIAVPLFFELLLGVAVGLVGTWLAARRGDEAAAAFALALQVQAMLFVFLRIVGAGVGVVVAQALGAGRRDRADALARAALGMAGWIGACAALTAAAGATPLLRALNAPAAVLPAASTLLAALAPSLLLEAWLATAAGVLRAHLRARDSLRLTLATQALHLVGVVAAMEAFGLIGFALGTLVSRVFGVAMAAWLWRARLSLAPRAGDLWRLPRPELAAILRVGLPGAAENIAYRLAFVVSVAAAGALGAGALATQAYVLQLNLVTLLFGLAAGLAAEVVIGQRVGAGRLRDADRLLWRTLRRSLAISVAVTLPLALASPWVMRAFSSDAAVIAAGGVLLWWSVLLEPGRTFNVVVINALRAAGDVRFPVIVGAGSMLVVLAGGSWWLGVERGLGLPGVWIAYAADEWLRGLLMMWRWRSRAWVPMARAARRRITASPAA